MPKECTHDYLTQLFNLDLNDRVRRCSDLPRPPIIPYRFFSKFSAQCIDMYIDGYFYGCIAQCQAVAEGISQFLIEKNGIVLNSDEHRTRVKALQNPKKKVVISPQAYKAFKTIHGHPKEDRNAFHHLDENVEQNQMKLEARAKECVTALIFIQSEVFATTIQQPGCLTPVHPHYWPIDGDKMLCYIQ